MKKIVTVDDREPFEIQEGFEELGWTVIRKRLIVGDCVSDAIGFERKTFPDLKAAINKKYFFRQMIDLKNNYKKAYLILVGDYGRLRNWRDIKPTCSALTRTARIPDEKDKHGLDMHIVPVPNNRKAVEAMVNLLSEVTDSRLPQRIVTRKDRSLEEIKEDSLTALPSIGLTKAKRILKLVDYGLGRLVTLDEKSMKLIGLKPHEIKILRKVYH